MKREAGAPVPDIAWGTPQGELMQPDDWDNGFGRAISVFLNGDGIRERDRRGEQITDRHFILLFNAGDEPIDFHIPDIEFSPTSNCSSTPPATRPTAIGLTRIGGARRSQGDDRAPASAAQGIDADHSVAASLAAAVPSSTEDMPAHAPRPEVLQ